VHEGGGHLLVPRSLSLVEKRHMFDWRGVGIDQTVIAKVMDVLNE
jgi:hypothetical protein